MLSKSQLTSHSRMSGSWWVTTPLLLSGSLQPFLYSSSVYSCYFMLISSASVTSLPFLSFVVPICAWNSPLVSLIFLKSLVFPILLFSSIFCIVHLRSLFHLSLLFFGTLHSVGYILPFLLWLSFLFLAICKASSDKHSALLHFFFMVWFWSPPPVQCYEPSSIVLQAPDQI